MEIFFDTPFDPAIQERTKGITIYYSTDDEVSVGKSVEALVHLFPAAHIKRYTDKGHFTTEDMGGDAFPELLEDVVRGV